LAPTVTLRQAQGDYCLVVITSQPSAWAIGRPSPFDRHPSTARLSSPKSGSGWLLSGCDNEPAFGVSSWSTVTLRQAQGDWCRVVITSQPSAW